MDKTFSDETLRKALSLNLIELPDGYNSYNINELDTRLRILVSTELIQHLKELQKRQALINTTKIDDDQSVFAKPLIVLGILCIIITMVGILSLYRIINIKVGISMLILMTSLVATDVLVMIRLQFKILRMQVAQATPMVDELYQRQFNNN